MTINDKLYVSHDCMGVFFPVAIKGDEVILPNGDVYSLDSVCRADGILQLEVPSRTEYLNMKTQQQQILSSGKGFYENHPWMDLPV